MAALDPVCLILCGGSGTRFWPSSTPEKPKQYLNLFGAQSLLQATYARASRITSAENIYACSLEEQKPLLTAQLPDLQLILEPAGRNTAPCLMLSVAHLLKKGLSPQTPMLVMPSDHHIQDETGFVNLALAAMAFSAKSGGLIALGIVPTFAHTGYGYIEAGATAEKPFQKITRFVEKPNESKAREFLEQGNFFWNAGIFVWTLATIAEAFAQFLPKEWAAITKALGTPALNQVYASLPSTPIDVAVMEKTERGFVVPARMGWSDVGSWSALKDLLAEEASANVVVGTSQRTPQVFSLESQGCLVKTASASQVALVGVSNLIVVEDNGRLLVAHRDSDQKIKEVVQAFSKPLPKSTP